MVDIAIITRGKLTSNLRKVQGAVIYLEKISGILDQRAVVAGADRQHHVDFLPL